MASSTTPAASRLLNVAAAADYLGTPERFIRRLVDDRRIRFIKLGRHVRFDPADLDAFVAAGTVEAKPAA